MIDTLNQLQITISKKCYQNPGTDSERRKNYVLKEKKSRALEQKSIRMSRINRHLFLIFNKTVTVPLICL
jgi:AAA15 family ATPase/GTPase